MDDNITRFNETLGFVPGKSTWAVVIVYLLTILGFVLHVIAIKRKWVDDPISTKPLLLLTLSVVDIVMCLYYSFFITMNNVEAVFEKVVNLLPYLNFIPAYHMVILHFITADSFVKVRLSFQYNDEKISKRWLAAIIVSAIVVPGFNVIRVHYIPLRMVGGSILAFLLLVNLLLTYTYILFKLFKTSLHQPQVVGYFLDSANGPAPDFRRTNKKLKQRRFVLSPSIKRALYSIPFLILIMHTIFIIIPNAIVVYLIANGRSLSPKYWNIVIILGSIGINGDALVYIFIKKNILRRILSSIKVSPAPHAPPSRLQLDRSASKKIDYSWAIFDNIAELPQV